MFFNAYSSEHTGILQICPNALSKENRIAFSNFNTASTKNRKGKSPSIISFLRAFENNWCGFGFVFGVSLDFSYKKKKKKKALARMEKKIGY